MASSKSPEIIVIESEVEAVCTYMEKHPDKLQLGAMGRVDQAEAVGLAAKLLRSVKGKSLMEIVNSRRAQHILNDISKLRLMHAASGSLLDDLDEFLTPSVGDDNSHYEDLCSEVLYLQDEINELIIAKAKIDTTFKHVRISLNDTLNRRNDLIARRFGLESKIFLPFDDPPERDDQGNPLNAGL